MTFDDLHIAKSLLKALHEVGFTTPTPIQQKAIPPILGGRDVIGIAQTGTGKTAAYLLPILSHLTGRKENGPRALVLVPTRELALQVEEDLAQLLTYSNICYASIYGGIGITKHAEMLQERNPDIVVATIGRLKDLYSRGAISLKYVKHLIIDEADRILDMGFLPQLNQLLEVLPPKRQHLLFSATFAGKVEKLTHDFMAFPKYIEIAQSGTPAKQIKQVAYHVPNYRTKLNLVSYLLDDKNEYQRVIIFCSTKESANAVYKVIKRKTEGEIRVIHSNKGQASRINAIRDFKNGEVRILITTDVSARGIDVSKVSHVINFEMPADYQDYVHRIGRTGRVNDKGIAISLINKAEEFDLQHIEKIICMPIERLSMPQKVEIIPTEKAEIIAIERVIDQHRRKADPNFKGAFHEKKKRPVKKDKKENKKSFKRKR